MRKILALMLAVMCFCCVSCTDKAENNTEAESTCPYALMHDGVMYYYTGESVFDKMEYTDGDILGSVTSTIPETGMPSIDGQANIDIEGSIYIRHSDGLLVLINGEWTVFETRDKTE